MSLVSRVLSLGLKNTQWDLLYSTQCSLHAVCAHVSMCGRKKYKDLFVSCRLISEGRVDLHLGRWRALNVFRNMTRIKAIKLRLAKAGVCPAHGSFWWHYKDGFIHEMLFIGREWKTCSMRRRKAQKTRKCPYGDVPRRCSVTKQSFWISLFYLSSIFAKSLLHYKNWSRAK